MAHRFEAAGRELGLRRQQTPVSIEKKVDNWKQNNYLLA
jgi:hypothetical protein